jgi:curved DNA-binding protein CbpA
MFKDYYQILGIPFTASTQEIKDAYRKMSLKWHPDKNPNIDVTEIMQDINEAYKILYDEFSRARYDKEYEEFRCHKNLVRHYDCGQSWNYYYDIKDDYLKDDIYKARAYAHELVNDFFDSLKESSKNATNGAIRGLKWFFMGKYK